MSTELYIFNKQSKENPDFTNWDDSQTNVLEEGEISYSLGKFKTKVNAFKEIINELNFRFKENEGLSKFFKDFHLNVSINADHHHILSYNFETKKLIIDAEIRSEFIPIYLYALYFSSLRKIGRDEDELFKKLSPFIDCFSDGDLDRLKDFLKKNPIYDVGDHFKEYLSKDRDFLSTQLLRNRSLVGKTPWNLEYFEELRESHKENPFSGEANEALFIAFKESYDKDFARDYYKHLLKALKKIKLGVIAQRGSRVAHEQGPILINSSAIKDSKDLEIETKKFNSSVLSIAEHISSLNKLKLDEDPEIQRKLITLNLELEELSFLTSLKDLAEARVKKSLNLIEKSLLEIFSIAENKVKELKTELLNKRLDTSSCVELIGKINNNRKSFSESLLDLEKVLKDSSKTKKNAVILVQRASSRSGHLIPRFLIGEKLYIETDKESEKQRILAIPYNFMVTDFHLIADGIDAFFENAAISIVTDKQTGDPEIKWENAEDLAINIAEPIYQAIYQAREKNFLYQLETTLFGPLIDLFKALLENELSNIASVELAGGKEEVEKKVESYQKEFTEAAEIIFKCYLLEDSVLEKVYSESISREEALLEISLSLKDVLRDIARYCIAKNRNQINEDDFNYEKLIFKAESNQEILKQIDKKLSIVSDDEAKEYIKKYIKFPRSTARKEYLSQNKSPRKIISSNKKMLSALKHFDFTVAPSRINFGKGVVASVTSLMGRILGADDKEAIKSGKEYIDLVSQCPNTIFETSSEAGIAKVAENTCRAMQYAKTIAFQGVFQYFDADGESIRNTINSRDNKTVGIHTLEHGTMASTGYCITKEPLFILLSLAMNSDELLSKLGINEPQTKNKLKELMKDLFKEKSSFSNNQEWEIYAYEKLCESEIIQKHIAEEALPWLPNLESLITLFNYLGEKEDLESSLRKEFSSFASELISNARVLNETGIIQRIQICNEAINKAKIRKAQAGDKVKDDDELVFGLNASYKGNVSDERENANQYLMAILLKQEQFIKNLSIKTIRTLLNKQFENNKLPKEIKITDPYVDSDIFMGGELKSIAEETQEKLISLSSKFSEPFTPELIQACIISYGSDILNWKIFQKKLKEVDEYASVEIKNEIESLMPQIKFLETYHKGFTKNPQLGYQACDIIQLNSDHDELINFFEDLSEVKSVMKVKNPDSLLVLIDNPQQGKARFLDHDRCLEWLALGGTLGSHMISVNKFETWREELNKELNWARSFVVHFLKHDPVIETQLKEYINEIKEYADLKREQNNTRYYQAEEICSNSRILNRYKASNQAIVKCLELNSLSEINFADWLALGGRWLLNGSPQAEIDYIIDLFNNSEELSSLSKRDFDYLELFVRAEKAPEIETTTRIIKKSGSTKESDLIVGLASTGIEARAALINQSKGHSIRHKEMERFTDQTPLEELFKLWERKLLLFEDLINSNAEDTMPEKERTFGQMLKILEQSAEYFCNKYLEENKKSEFHKVKNFVNQKDGFLPYMEAIFGDHRNNGGLFQKLAFGIASEHLTNKNAELLKLSKLGEMFNTCFLLFLTINIDDENEMVNKLAIFFDQFLNVHESDYPPYMFHRVCAGDSYGFSEGYSENPQLRQKMYEISCETSKWIYKHLHYLISKKTILKETKAEYRDLLIGDFERGIIPICYQHETISVEERLWDCMRSLRDFIRNYHDRHPLPVILKGETAKVENLFPETLKSETVWIAGLSNPGKHSWDVSCVFKSPKIREMEILDENGTYINIPVFAPYLSPEGEIKQIYTSFNPKIINSSTVECLYPFSDETYKLNSEGNVHALVSLEGSLPKPSVTMSAHTHPQYLNKSTLKWGYPEAWSYLNMRQMYSKTELSKILDVSEIEALAQIEFYENEFNTIEEIKDYLKQQVESLDYTHIDKWILKASKDSGGRGISSALSIEEDLEEMAKFIYLKTRTDDLVMQEFISNNAKAFTLSEFIDEVKDDFIASGIGISSACPEENMHFSTRAFQSINGIKGYLFSVNVGAVTVNAGQGARMFFGEPISIMPLFLAGKIQKLMDEYGESLLKNAIPKHAKSFALENNIEVVENSCGFTNTHMLNGLFDYIPYFYASRKNSSGIIKRYKIHSENNAYGGLDYFYKFEGEKVLVAQGKDHKDSVESIMNAMKETISDSSSRPEDLIDVDLAVIELNSGLGQANLLQRVLDKTVDKKDLFLEWTLDLGSIGRMYQLSENKDSIKH